MSEKDLPSTSSSKSFRVPSYNYAGWCRLREVCCALKQMQEKVEKQKQEVYAKLKSQEDYREQAALVQAETVELRSLRERIEKAKCRLMTIQLKLIQVYSDSDSKEREKAERQDQVLNMGVSFQTRLSANTFFRDKLSVASSRLILRRRRLLQELMVIYKIDLDGRPANRIFPTTCACVSVATIAGLHLPRSKSLAGHTEAEVSTAAGYVVHLLILMSQILNVSLRFPVIFQGSRSSIVNPISTEIFPLYSVTKNREKFEEAINHLNGNIAQLRSDCGLGTTNENRTLQNLQNLLLHMTVEDAEPKFVRPVRNVQSPASVLRTLVSDSVMVDHVKKVSESRRSLNASTVDTVKTLPRCSSADARNSSLLFDSSAVAAMNLTSRSNLATSSKVNSNSETANDTCHRMKQNERSIR